MCDESTSAKRRSIDIDSESRTDWTGRVIRAVFMDMDGVVVDSIPNHSRAWVEAFAARGISLDPVLPRLREGEKALLTCHWLSERYGLGWTEEECVALVAEKRQRFRSYGVPQIFPGVNRLLDDLGARRLPCVLVTGSARVNVNHSLGDTLHRFHHVIAAEDVMHGKPDPEPYLRAVDRVMVPPSECLVIENAPFGIEAARRAGCRVVALTTTLEARHLDGADSVLDSHERILELLDSGK